MPHLRGLDVSAADTAPAQAGFITGTVTYPADTTCSHIGRVMSPTPRAGSAEIPGTRVSRRAGELPSIPSP